ncbi:hypothetical protein AGMMS49982_21150 [Bacteroidia bacterium]|nr:hypothetical protein AGMMS49982_21150 [Bacteroidia bacterium]
MKNFRKTAIFMLMVFAGFYSCEEGERFGISSDDTKAPEPPVYDSVQVLPGGARIFYRLPDDRDILSIEASYTAANGKLMKFACSFAAPYLEVYGLSDTLENTTVQLYALDRAGNHSKSVDVPFKPLKPAYLKVAEELTVKAGFGAVVVNWQNELEQDITVIVDFTYSDTTGTQRSLRQAYSSKRFAERHFLNDLQGTVSVKANVADLYGNESGFLDKGNLQILTDEKLDKSKMRFPNPGTLMDGKYMSYGSGWAGRINRLIDDVIDYRYPVGTPDNFAHFGTPQSNQYIVDGMNVNQFPWQIFIDLGEKYELSRIVTYQGWDAEPSIASPTYLGSFYGGDNVGEYRMFYWDGDDDGIAGVWEEIRQVRIPMPEDLGNLGIIRLAIQGNEELMYPDEPQFTPATRFFRYEPVASFRDNYAPGGCLLVSELTLYGRKAQ